ncbi:hypothetical protein [Nocardiopsis sp. NPDC057823]|uniref:hypothetical protein n=1 Tax=Nocardiopsis sp. NPDC057823 TaxID=3346256 RepID=UPI00366EE0F0
MIRRGRQALLAAAALAALAAAGCAPEAGQVTDRRYTPAHSWVDQQCTTILQPSGQSVRTCTPVTRYEPDRYALRLEAGDDAGWRRVPEDEYDRCHTGDQYPACAREGTR